MKIRKIMLQNILHFNDLFDKEKLEIKSTSAEHENDQLKNH